MSASADHRPKAVVPLTTISSRFRLQASLIVGKWPEAECLL
jgi:hypothetical protein